MQYLKSFLYLLVTTFSILISGCAVNRVEYVNSAKDAQSFYKIAVIYGSCGKNKKTDTDISGPHFVFEAFGEFVSVTQKGTGGCLGSNDYFSLPLSHNGCIDNEVQYHVVMVPPDEYVHSRLKFQNDQNHYSAYFKAEGTTPIYLGNFNAKMTQKNNKYRYMYLPISSIDYDMDKAKQVLEGFD
ncbi:MAG: hypothetical protein AAF621_07900, partial [Pseudomonadota bacterium]